MTVVGLQIWGIKFYSFDTDLCTLLDSEVELGSFVFNSASFHADVGHSRCYSGPPPLGGAG